MRSLRSVCSLRLLAGWMVMAAVCLGLWACASMGTPGGGPRDEDPPQLVRANPPYGATGVARDLSRISFLFDEIINVKDAFSKVVVSPPLKEMPRISASGRRVTVDLQDSLSPDMTYTIDFADAIEDNNEANRLPGFFYAFSTGAQLDSLEISGMVLSADGLEPQQQMIVGLYKSSYADRPDSSFFLRPFDRMAFTDDRGRFFIGGLKSEPYYIYALRDLDSDKHYANPEEDLAFLPYPVTPHSERIETTDTLYNLKTGQIDTVTTRTRTLFLPNDLLLRSFNTGRRIQYLKAYERPDSTRITLTFNDRADSLPRISIEGFPKGAADIITEHSPGYDTITYWLPRYLATRDTIRLNTTYLRPDSTGRLVSGTDLLELTLKRQSQAVPSKKKKTKNQQYQDSLASLRRYRMQATVSAGSKNQEVWQPLAISFEAPLNPVDSATFTLQQKKDTFWIPVPKPYKTVRFDTLSSRRLKIDYPWDFSTTYRLSADSASVTDIYGRAMDPVSVEFSTLSEEDYSSLSFNIQGAFPGETAFVELLDNNDRPVRRQPVVEGKVSFQYLTPGKYYARYVEDFDGNGDFTPGDPAAGILPDQAFYYPKRITLKKNWDLDQTWNPFETPVDKQKPEVIKTNKPAAAKSNRNSAQEQEEEDEPFDPTANPFDPNQAKKRKQARQNQLM